jgi:hypothetical protein
MPTNCCTLFDFDQHTCCAAVTQAAAIKGGAAGLRHLNSGIALAMTTPTGRAAKESVLKLQSKLQHQLQQLPHVHSSGSSLKSRLALINTTASGHSSSAKSAAVAVQPGATSAATTAATKTSKMRRGKVKATAQIQHIGQYTLCVSATSNSLARTRTTTTLI